MPSTLAGPRGWPISSSMRQSCEPPRPPHLRPTLTCCEPPPQGAESLTIQPQPHSEFPEQGLEFPTPNRSSVSSGMARAETASLEPTGRPGPGLAGPRRRETRLHLLQAPRLRCSQGPRAAGPPPPTLNSSFTKGAYLSCVPWMPTLVTPRDADEERAPGSLEEATARGWKWKAAPSPWGPQEQGHRGRPPTQAGVSRASGLRGRRRREPDDERAGEPAAGGTLGGSGGTPGVGKGQGGEVRPDPYLESSLRGFAR